MTTYELDTFWLAVRAANRACLAELASKPKVTRRLDFETFMHVTEVRRETTESLRVFRPLERALQALRQAGHCSPWVRDRLKAQVARRMRAVVMLGMSGGGWSDYFSIELPELGLLDASPAESVFYRAKLRTSGRLTLGNIVALSLDASKYKAPADDAKVAEADALVLQASQVFWNSLAQEGMPAPGLRVVPGKSGAPRKFLLRGAQSFGTGYVLADGSGFDADLGEPVTAWSIIDGF